MKNGGFGRGWYIESEEDIFDREIKGMVCDLILNKIDYLYEVMRASKLKKDKKNDNVI